MNFANKSNLLRHNKKHTGKMEICTMCTKTFVTNYDLNMNIKSMHQEGIKYPCSECDKCFTSKTGLSNHIKGHIYIFLCTVCGKGYNNKLDFESHKFDHEGVKPYVCEKCGKTYQHKEVRNMHSAHCGINKPKITCDHCGKWIKKIKYLKEHLKGHDNPERYQCSQCGSVYKYRSGLF